MIHASRAFCIAALLTLVAVPSSFAADVHVGINIGVPPPVLVAPPPFVVVPSTPAVSYAPEAPYDVFFYGGQYYAWHGGWFVAGRVGDPWVAVEPYAVPRPIQIVPARFYKVPPGHFHRVPPGHMRYEGGGREGHGGHEGHGHGGHGHGKHEDR